MEHAWDGYVKYAWGSDFLKPVSLNGTDLAKVTFNSVHSGAKIMLNQLLCIIIFIFTTAANITAAIKLFRLDIRNLTIRLYKFKRILIHQVDLKSASNFKDFL